MALSLGREFPTMIGTLNDVLVSINSPFTEWGQSMRTGVVQHHPTFLIISVGDVFLTQKFNGRWTIRV